VTELERLRERIRTLDEDILRLIAARMETAKAVGQHKKLEGIPLRDWNVERQVLDRATRQAADFDLPTQVARSVMQTLIAAARAEQERTSFSSYRGAAESILIIGGRGTMGRWFTDFFGNQGHRVSVYDTQPGNNDAPGVTTLEAALDATSCALIAVPLDVVPSVIEQLAATRYRGIVFDIASLKGHLKPAIARARDVGVAVTSIHPMFGPGARTLSDQVICICDCGDSQATRKVEGFFSDTAATLVKLSLDEHDRVISYVLGLSHLTNLVFTKVLMESGKRFDEFNQVGSTTFHSQMATASTVIQENPELYYAIQRLNPFSQELCESFQREFETIVGWVRNADRQAFGNMMQMGRQWMTGNDAD
jgi:chorismate mutase/prephenate dehydrogenase